MIALWAVLLLASPASFDTAVQLEMSAQHGDAITAYRAFAAAHPHDPRAPEALWDAARIAVDHLANPVLAYPVIEDLLTHWPKTKAATRARALGVWLNRQPALGMRTVADHQAHLEAHPDAWMSALVVAQTLGTDAAHTLRQPFWDHAEFGWLIQQEDVRQRYNAGQYIAAWVQAREIGDAVWARRSRWKALKHNAPYLLIIIVLLGWFWRDSQARIKRRGGRKVVRM